MKRNTGKTIKLYICYLTPMLELFVECSNTIDYINKSEQKWIGWIDDFTFKTPTKSNNQMLA